jgi:hypothetical protein
LGAKSRNFRKKRGKTLLHQSLVCSLPFKQRCFQFATRDWGTEKREQFFYSGPAKKFSGGTPPLNTAPKQGFAAGRPLIASFAPASMGPIYKAATVKERVPLELTR